MSAPSIVQANWVTTPDHAANPAPALSGVTAGNYLLSIIGFGPSGGANGVTFAAPSDTGGNTFLSVASQASVNGTQASSGIQAFGVASAAAGTHTLSYANGTNQCYAYAGLLEISGVASVDQAVVTSVARGNTTLTITSGTLANASELLIAAIAPIDETFPANAAVTDPHSGWTSEFAYQVASTSQIGEVCYRTPTGTGAVSAAWTWAHSGAAAALLVSFAPAGGSSSTTRRRGMSGGMENMGGGMQMRSPRDVPAYLHRNWRQRGPSRIFLPF